MLLFVACDIKDPFLILKGSTFDILVSAYTLRKKQMNAP